MHGLANMKKSDLAAIDTIVAEFFGQLIKCECRIPWLENTFRRSLSRTDVEAAMMFCFFSCVMQSAVHSYGNSRWTEYKKLQDHDFQVYGHGGTHRVYAPFIEGIRKPAVIQFAQSFMRDWAATFDRDFGDGKSQRIIRPLLNDKAFHWAIGSAQIGVLQTLDLTQEMS